MLGKTADMHFVDDRPRAWPFQRLVAFPVIGARIHHDALHGWCCGFSVKVPRNGHGSSVRIEQHFAGIKSHPICWIPWSVDAIAVELAGSYTWHEYMPIVIGPVHSGVKWND